MVWSVLVFAMALLLDLITAHRQPEGAKDLEIVFLRQQLRVLQRRRPRPQLSRWEKVTPAVLATKLRQLTAGSRQRWSRSVLLVTPETLLRWHRNLVRRKWTFRGCRGAGRPRTMRKRHPAWAGRLRPPRGSRRAADRRADRCGIPARPARVRGARPGSAARGPGAAEAGCKRPVLAVDSIRRDTPAVLRTRVLGTRHGLRRWPTQGLRGRSLAAGIASVIPPREPAGRSCGRPGQGGTDPARPIRVTRALVRAGLAGRGGGQGGGGSAAPGG